MWAATEDDLNFPRTGTVTFLVLVLSQFLSLYAGTLYRQP